MNLIEASLIERVQRTPEIASFRFRPESRLYFRSGQFTTIFFDPDRPANRELNKYLSFSCSPTRDYIEVTKRLSQSAFSQSLNALKPGSKVKLASSAGNCVLEDGYQKIGFLIGGIGITPVISMLDFINETDLNIDSVLLYSNRTEQDIAFHRELDVWRERSRLKVGYFLTDQPATAQMQEAEIGRIDPDALQRWMPDVKERILFIFGPPRMVQAMKEVCLAGGCRSENVKTEQFLGY